MHATCDMQHVDAACSASPSSVQSRKRKVGWTEGVQSPSEEGRAVGEGGNVPSIPMQHAIASRLAWHTSSGTGSLESTAAGLAEDPGKPDSTSNRCRCASEALTVHKCPPAALTKPTLTVTMIAGQSINDVVMYNQWIRR